MGQSSRKGGSLLTTIATSVLVAFIVGCVGATGLVRQLRQSVDGVTRETTVTETLDAPSPDFENILLVGSDSREGSDPNDPDFATMGAESDVGGKRGDTLMVMHYVKKTGGVSLISVPRDLWVKIGNGEKEQRINTAYQVGTDVLVRTVRRALGIPIHHYVEVNFQGFKQIVDAIGGVSICVDRPSRDKSTGLFLKPGCTTLNGVKALAYARSRHFEQNLDGQWSMDATADIGRTARQRKFVQTLASEAVTRLMSNPLRAGALMSNGLDALVVSESLDIMDFAKRMRGVAGGGMTSFPLPVYGDTVQGNSVLRLGEGSAELLAFFAGTGPRPQIQSD
jgi:LCP family protein required for cell wall assembly